MYCPRLLERKKNEKFEIVIVFHSNCSILHSNPAINSRTNDSLNNYGVGEVEAALVEAELG